MSYLYELKDINCFIQLARAGSLTRASLTYNVPKASLSHQLRRLEDALQVELFVRKAQGLELTDAGKEYLNHCGRIFDTCEVAASAAQRAHSTISGKVRIAASSEFGTSIIGAAAFYVASSSPQLDFDLQMYPNEKLIAGQIDFDCMIYVGDPPDSSMLRRKMGEVSSGLYASPAFLSRFGVPKSAEEINRLDGVMYIRNGIVEKWQLSRDRNAVTAQPYERFTVNEYWMAKYFTVEGAAIGYLPDFFVHYEVEQGALVPVLPKWRSEKSPIHIIYPAHRHRNPRVMNLVEAMCSRFHDFIRHPGYALIKRDYAKTKRQRREFLTNAEPTAAGAGNASPEADMAYNPALASSEPTSFSNENSQPTSATSAAAGPSQQTVKSMSTSSGLPATKKLKLSASTSSISRSRSRRRT